MDLEQVAHLLTLGWWALCFSARTEPEREFHTLRKIKPGHWRYMGHDIIRDEKTHRWYTDPPSEECPFKTKDSVRWHLYHEYEKLVRSAVEIEDERKNTQ